MRILITGSRGFIGGSVGRYACANRHDVLGIARASQPERDWVGRYLQADVAHADLGAAIGDFRPDVVFHGAGTASVGASLAAPVDDLRAAVMTWANVLESVRRSSLRPLIVFPSSAAVYGNPERLPVAEDSPISPISPYGFHKAACELLAREYASCFGLSIAVFRLFSVFGPAQRRLLVWELAEQFIRHEPVVWLQGTGEESRDFLYVDDFAEAVLQLSLRSSAAAAGRCEFWNIGSGQRVRTIELAEQIRRLTSATTQIRCKGVVRAGDPRDWQADVSRFCALEPAWKPRQLAAGLSDCLDVWRLSNAGPASSPAIGPIEISPAVRRSIARKKSAIAHPK